MSSLNPALYGCLQIRNSAFCYYQQYAEQPERSRKQKLNERNLINTYSGEISRLSKKNISRAVQLLLMASPKVYYINPLTNKKNSHRLTFITLTYSCSNIVVLNEEYKLSLKPFLRWLCEIKGVKNYVWKAEYQKRGQLHYHITTNKFILHHEIKDKWNYIQKSNGYLTEYFDTHGHYNPNSTDVAAVYKINNIEAYLVKYLSKSVGNNTAKGKVWGCSDNLRGKQYFTYDYVPESFIDGIRNAEINGQVHELKDVENCTYWKIDKGKDFYLFFDKSDRKLIENYINSDFKKTIEYLNNLQNQNNNNNE
jgi:hypothetical protein